MGDSRLFSRGYGESGVDFLKTNYLADNVITNPPYNLAEEFADKAYSSAKDKSALLLRLSFLEGSKRAKGLFKRCRPKRILVFSERITFYPNGVKTAGSGTIAYAWFIWDKSNPDTTNLDWIEPGLRMRHTE